MQTFHIITGVLVAIGYSIAVTGWGLLFLSAIFGRQVFLRTLKLDSLLWIWLGFILGQGIWGSIWLFLALGGAISPWVIYPVMMIGFVLIPILIPLTGLWRELKHGAIHKEILLLIRKPSFASWIGLGLITTIFLQGISALLPAAAADSIYRYLVIPKAIAYTGQLDFQPFVPTFYGLLPLQIETHWAALFNISNETAVTFWDFICSVSVLVGISLLSMKITGSKKVALFSTLILISTPAFLELMGVGKTDNASTQFGIAAFLWLTMLFRFGWKTTWLAGLCIGYSLACRYTNIIVVPSLLIFLGVLLWNPKSLFGESDEKVKIKHNLPVQLLLIAIFASVGFAPMLIKNWLLVGCPLAPVLGCENTFWANLYHKSHGALDNISLLDLILYPFTWTYASRRNMLGNISPLFLGFFPLLFIYRRFHLVKVSILASLAGMAGLISWLLIEPFILFTRWLLLPLSLFTIPLGAAFTVADNTLQKNHIHWPKFFMRSALALMVVFSLFESRSAIYGIAYLFSVHSRDAAYSSSPGYDTAVWMNSTVKPGERVALNLASTVPPYFFDPEILYSSESSVELQELWLNPELKTWDYYVVHGFKYVVVTQEYLEKTNSNLPLQIGNRRLEIVFEGKDQVVVEISDVENDASRLFLINKTCLMGILI